MIASSLKKYLALGALPLLIFSMLLFTIVIASDEDNSSYDAEANAGLNLSAAVLKYQSNVEKYCKQYGISKYVDVILAIMQVESGGNGSDVM